MDVQDFLKELSAVYLTASVSSIKGSMTPRDSFVRRDMQTQKISVTLFALFLKKRIVPHSSISDLTVVSECIDIDKDGFIGKEDLETFLKRSYLYRSDNQLAKTMRNNEKLPLYPTKALSEEDVNNLLRELRREMMMKRVSNYELFQRMDTNHDGFISIDEFCNELDKILPIPQEIKEGFFAYIDKNKIGVIDYNSLLLVLKKSFVTSTMVSYLLDRINNVMK